MVPLPQVSDRIRLHNQYNFCMQEKQAVVHFNLPLAHSLLFKVSGHDQLAFYILYVKDQK